MASRIIDGKQVSADIRQKIANEVKIQIEHGIQPCLATILLGENPSSISYVRAKHRACAEAGIATKDRNFSIDTTQQELLRHIESCNADPDIHGILVQLPLPKQIDTKQIVSSISPEKDVDGFHPLNLGALVREQAGFRPCTPLGVIELLRYYKIPLAGKRVVIVGRSLIVGRPLALLLASKTEYGNATVTICHSATVDLPSITRQADILIAAMGMPNSICGDMVSDDSVVIDVGVNRVVDKSRKNGYRLCGDVEFDSVSQKANYITPVPGGVGPMTIAMLLSNTLLASKNQNIKKY